MIQNTLKFLYMTAVSKQEFKVVMVGDSGVGKTSLVEKFYTGGFNESQNTTVGAAYVKALVSLNESTNVTLNIWDTAGQERFQSLIPLYLRNALGIIFVFDLSAQNSIQMLDSIYASLQDQLTDEMQILLCGNKVDLRDGNFELLPFTQWAQKHGTILMITSAKTGHGVKDLFFEIAARINNNLGKSMSNKTVDDIVGLTDEPKESNSCC